jgi:hypothetical protein
LCAAAFLASLARGDIAGLCLCAWPEPEREPTEPWAAPRCRRPACLRLTA